MLTVWGPLLALVALLAGALGALAVRRLAPRLHLIAPVEARSSHRMPTPTGGGIGMALGGSLAALPLALMPGWTGMAVAGICLAIGLLGLVDDLRPLSPALRLPLQVAGLAGLVALLMPDAGPLLFAVLVLGGAWWLNLFNFMDGIDGLAASEAGFILIAGALLVLAGNPLAPGEASWWWLVGCAAGALGFLACNWPPAKVFMGDAGSMWLGATIFALALLSATAPGWPPLWVWPILGAAFTADATVTLLYRLLRGQKVWQAHRSHAYQLLARRWGSHRAVTLAFLAVNIVWLLPLAWLATANPDAGFWLALLAHLPLVLAALWAGAGRADDI